MIWWIWMLLGIGLLALEAAAPGGLFALFFGLSALLVGLLTALGWAGPIWMQWLLFSAVAIAALAVLRGPLKGRLNVKGSQRQVDSLVGEAGAILEDVAPGGVGKVEIRGSSWNARSQGGVPLTRGQRCKVESVEGLTLWVRPE
jgi:hypothetical protein